MSKREKLEQKLAAKRQQVETTEAAIPYVGFERDKIFPNLEDFPVQPLGINGSIIFLAHRKTRKIHEGTERTLKNSVSTIVGDEDDHEKAATIFPQFKKEGDKMTIAGINSTAMFRALIAKANSNNFFSNDNIRGMGCWRDRDGNLVINTGNELFLSQISETGTSLKSLTDGLHAGYYYESQSSSEKIINKKYTTDPSSFDIDKIFTDAVAILSQWQFAVDDKKNPIFTKMLLGFIFTSFLGHANHWRPHAWITGRAGSGKTTLFTKIFKKIFGNFCISNTGATEAGVRQELQHGCAPILLDETESSEAGDKIRNLIFYARQSSSGGKISRGGDGQKSISFSAYSCFMFFSIVAASFAGADITRWQIFNIYPRKEKTLILPPNISEIFRALFSCLVRHWGQFDRVHKIIYNEIQIGSSRERTAQMYAALFAPVILCELNEKLTLRTDTEIATFFKNNYLSQLLFDADVIGRQDLTSSTPEEDMLSLLLDFNFSDKNNAKRPLTDIFNDAICYVLLKEINDGEAKLRQKIKTDLEKEFSLTLEEDMPEISNNTIDKEFGMRLGLWRKSAETMEQFGMRVYMKKKSDKDKKIYLAIANRNPELQKQLYAVDMFKSPYNTAETAWSRHLKDLPNAQSRVNVRYEHGTAKSSTLIPLETIYEKTQFLPSVPPFLNDCLQSHFSYFDYIEQTKDIES